MIGYLLRRLMWSALTLLVLSLTCFAALRALPGGPFDALEHLPESARIALEARYGLDDPWFSQWARYVWGLATFDLGPSLGWPDQQVAPLVGAAFAASAVLGIGALLIALPIGWGGALLATRMPLAQARWLDALAPLPLMVPALVLAPLMVWLFAIELRWVPVTARIDDWRSLVLPALNLALPVAAQLYMLVRARTQVDSQSAHALAAQAAGVGGSEALRRLAISTTPAALAFLAPAGAGLLTGALVLEQIYSYPGLGRYFVLAAMNRDYPLLMAVVMVFGALLQVLAVLADVCARFADPRLGWD